MGADVHASKHSAPDRRTECLDAHVFESVEDCRQTMISAQRGYKASPTEGAEPMLLSRDFAELRHCLAARLVLVCQLVRVTPCRRESRARCVLGRKLVASAI